MPVVLVVPLCRVHNRSFASLTRCGLWNPTMLTVAALVESPPFLLKGDCPHRVAIIKYGIRSFFLVLEELTLFAQLAPHVPVLE
jgi:hypothetical protein